MARKQDPQEEFEELVKRMHGSGDLRIFKNYITAFRDELKHSSYDEKIISSPQLASHVNGQQCSFDHILTVIDSVLD